MLGREELGPLVSEDILNIVNLVDFTYDLLKTLCSQLVFTFLNSKKRWYKIKIILEGWVRKYY